MMTKIKFKGYKNFQEAMEGIKNGVKNNRYWMYPSKVRGKCEVNPFSGETTLSYEGWVHFSWTIDTGLPDPYLWEVLPNGELLEDPEILSITEKDVILRYGEYGEKRLRVRAAGLILETARDYYEMRWDDLYIDLSEGKIDVKSSEVSWQSREELLSRFFAEEARKELLEKFL